METVAITTAVNIIVAKVTVVPTMVPPITTPLTVTATAITIITRDTTDTGIIAVFYINSFALSFSSTDHPAGSLLLKKLPISFPEVTNHFIPSPFSKPNRCASLPTVNLFTVAFFRNPHLNVLDLLYLGSNCHQRTETPVETNRVQLCLFILFII